MIEINFSPFVAVMTTRTTCFLVMFFVHVGLMDIIMTIPAGPAYLPETPFAALKMTGKTGCCKVGPCQFEIRLIMPFYCIIRSFKAHGSMTIRTIWGTALANKLVFVVIGMAIGTTRCMTAGAGNNLVFSFQRVVGQGMIKVRRLPDPVK